MAFNYSKWDHLDVGSDSEGSEPQIAEEEDDAFGDEGDEGDDRGAPAPMPWGDLLGGKGAPALEEEDLVSSSDDDELAEIKGELREFRNDFAQFDCIVTHAVEDDVPALEKRLREGPNWRACLAYD